MRVWNESEMKNMADYHDLYLKTDVLVLADIFEVFRNLCLQYCGLDSCHYFSCPGLSWNAILKMMCLKLDLISDIDMYQCIENN